MIARIYAGEVIFVLSLSEFFALAVTVAVITALNILFIRASSITVLLSSLSLAIFNALVSFLIAADSKTGLSVRAISPALFKVTVVAGSIAVLSSILYDAIVKALAIVISHALRNAFLIHGHELSGFFVLSLSELFVVAVAVVHALEVIIFFFIMGARILAFVAISVEEAVIPALHIAIIVAGSRAVLFFSLVVADVIALSKATSVALIIAFII